MSAKITVSELQNAADQCVKCAVCLPHCPTYALSPEETESPRGRITLLQGIVHERLNPTDDIATHLNNCLSCGRCEQVCPARVPYTRLLDGTRAFVRSHPEYDLGPASKRRRFAAWLLASPRALALTAVAAHVTRKLMPERTRRNGTAAAKTRWLEWIAPSPPASARAHVVNPAKSDAWLFAGCLSDAFEKDLAVRAISLARAYGIELAPTPAGLCCGALYQHSGLSNQVQKLVDRAVVAVEDNDNPVVVLSSGCARGLKDGLGFSNHPNASETQSRITDLFTLLDQADSITFLPTSDRVGLYAPCSMNKQHTTHLLSLINKALTDEIQPVGRGYGCCGAAGDHMLTDNEKANLLAAPVVDEIISQNLTHVLVPNTGCAWHLRANLAQRNVKIVVEHPVVWLERHSIKSST